MRRIRAYISHSRPGYLVILECVAKMLTVDIHPFNYQHADNMREEYGWPAANASNTVLSCYCWALIVYISVRFTVDNVPMFDLFARHDYFNIRFSEEFTYEELMYEIEHKFPMVRSVM